MNPIIEKLFELQTLLQPQARARGEASGRVKVLREEVPVSFLGHFDRQVSRGRHAVAVVRNGVCGECHMKLPSGVASGLVREDEVMLCETCSCYLLLPPEELARQQEAVAAARARRLQKIRRAATAIA